MAWLVRALREAKGSEEGECGGCRRSGSKGRLKDDEQSTILITELGMAESEPGMQRVDWVWARVADVCGRWLKRVALLVERVCGDVARVSGV